ncbi:DUF5381 family protein [Metabacillus idriensis]|uniref:DUF5381 family protein n=1 Tax=Metabacillus idriensis TaxID=324768 RepID=UPI001CD47B7E|nr:DUF5381 family protein [Metabacillus idriensis]
MLNIKQTDSLIQVKGSKFYYSMIAVVILGGLVGCASLLIEGIKFSSVYSLLWLAGGFVFFPIFFYLFIWCLPGFIPGKVLVSLVEGEDGYVQFQKGNIPFNQIRNIAFVRNPINLINDIIIESLDGKITKIRTYNLIDETDFAILVDQYIFPYMREDAKKVWDRHVNLAELYDDARYERKYIYNYKNEQ